MDSSTGRSRQLNVMRIRAEIIALLYTQPRSTLQSHRADHAAL